MVKRNNHYKIHLLLVITFLMLIVFLNIWATNFLFIKADKVSQLSADVKSVKSKLEDINEAEKMITKNEQEISILDNYYFSDINLPPILKQIESLAQQNNLQVRVTYLDDNVKPGVVSATIFAFGDFNDQYEFYQKLYFLPFLIDVKRLEMQYGEIPTEYIDQSDELVQAWGANYLIEISGYLDNKEKLAVKTTDQDEE